MSERSSGMYMGFWGPESGLHRDRIGIVLRNTHISNPKLHMETRPDSLKTFVLQTGGLSFRLAWGRVRSPRWTDGTTAHVRNSV